MAKKKIIRHEAPQTDSEKPKAPKEPEPKPKSELPKRINEKDSGFGVIKVVVGAIIVLILGSTAVSRIVGRQESQRGHKTVGERCENTKECRSGTICYAYKEKRKHCMETCYNSKCKEGYTCVGAASQKRRKGIRITDVCVQDGR